MKTSKDSSTGSDTNGGCLDRQVWTSISAADFNAAEPFPWINPVGVVRQSAVESLRLALPDIELFTRRYDIRRRHGQRPHNRHTLEYHRGLPIADIWLDFIAELDSPLYRDKLAELFGTRKFFLTYHWHYAMRGCEVSPHCDASRKLGSHIFYFNTREDWDPEWGGQTLILDDGGKFDASCAPDYDDFERIIPGATMDNHSLLFGRRGNSWHAVRPITCPENQMRKVFIVVINKPTPAAYVKRLVSRWTTG